MSPLKSIQQSKIFFIWLSILFLNSTLKLPQLVSANTSLPELINIGAIFENGDQQLLSSLVQAVERINQNRIILPRTKLNVTAYLVDSHDTFNAARLACKLIQDRVWAIFSSRSESINWYIHSMTNELQIPHLSISWNYRSKYLFNINTETESGEADRVESEALTSTTPNNNRGWANNNLNYNNNILNNPNAQGLQWLGAVYGNNIYNRSSAFNRFGVNSRGGANYQPSQPPPKEEHYTVNLYPEANQLSVAYMDFVLSRNWKSFTLIYDQNEGLIMLKDLLRISSAVKRRHVKISVKQFPDRKVTSNSKYKQNSGDYDDDDEQGARSYARTNLLKDEEKEDYIYLKLLKDLKKTEHNFVLSVSPERALAFMRHAYKAKRMSEYDNFLIASLDMHQMDFSAFHNKTLANVTGLSMLSSSGQDDFELGMGHHYRSRFYGSKASKGGHYNQKLHQITTSEALIFDAITLFARSLDDLDRALNPDDIVEPMVSCESSGQKWPFGAHIVHYIKKMKMNGITGAIAFDQRGHRVNFTLDVVQLKPDGLKNVARWHKESGITSIANYTFDDSYKQILETMKYKELKVTVPPGSKPYIYLKDNHEELTGNDKFKGFGVDLLQMIAEVFQKEFKSDFKYSIRIVADQKYGLPNEETGEWDGMLGELMRHQADLAIGDLTATYLRETAVDFTMPFMNLGIAILFKKTAIPDPELFSFLKPLSVEVWFYLASAFLGISILFWILSRISPYEWVSPHSCDPEPLELENQFSIGNSLWFTIGSLMQQGSDLAPRALSTRILAGVWWFFTLIMISSYTANLAASLTLSRMAPAISNVEDLAKQTTIQYGCKKGGSTYQFFQYSNHTTYQRMLNTMESNPEVYIDKIEDAIDRVRKGGYAYLAESSTIEYQIQRKCDLYQVGTWLDNKGYGIATPTDSPYRAPISNAIVVLQDAGKLHELKKRWWVDYGGGLCTDDVKVSSAMELNIENVGGVFVVLMGGVATGCLFGALEFIWKSLKIARDERESIGKLIWLEIVRICTGGGSSRPIFQAQSSSNTVNQVPDYPNGDMLNNLSTLNSPGLTKASSFTSVNGGADGLSPNGLTTSLAPNSPFDYRIYNAMSPVPLPHPNLHHRQPLSYSSYDGSMAPLLSPSSAPSKSTSRFNNKQNPGLKSPSSYSTMY